MHDHHPTGHAHASPPDWPDTTDPVEFWDGMYESRDQVWSGRPNAGLVDEVAGLTPGRALDLGCGEGGDAIWLAEQGWSVLGVDVSHTALRRTEEHARERGVGDRVRTEHHDLAQSFPEGEFDLVVAPFLQSPLDFPTDVVLRRASRALAPGGRLVVVSHGEAPPWAPEQVKEAVFPTVEGTLAALHLDEDGASAGDWTVQTAELRARQVTTPDGHPGELVDLVVHVVRGT